MFRAKVVDRTDQISARVQACARTRQRPSTPCQATEATAEGAVEPFDVRRIDVAGVLRSFDDRRNHFTRTLINTARDAYHATLFVMFDDLRQVTSRALRNSVPVRCCNPTETTCLDDLRRFDEQLPFTNRMADGFFQIQIFARLQRLQRRKAQPLAQPLRDAGLQRVVTRVVEVSSHTKPVGEKPTYGTRNDALAAVLVV